MPSARQRQAVAGGVADEEHAVLGRRAQRVRDPVALVAERLGAEVLGQPHGRLLDVVARVERADADPHLVARGERPAVARAHVALVDPQLELLGRGRRGGPPARARAAPRAAARCPRTPSTRRQPSASTSSGALHVAAVGVDRRAGAPVDLRGLELGRPTAPTAARTGAGSRRSRTTSRSASGRSCRACGPASESNVWRIESSSPRLRSHSVGAAHAEVCRSPIS